MNVRRVESFLLRVVVQEEGLAGAPIVWRGRIQHVTTGNECQFEQIQDVLLFIAAHVNALGEAPADPDMPSANEQN